MIKKAEKREQIVVGVPVKAKADKVEIARRAYDLGMTTSEYCYMAIEAFTEMTTVGLANVREYAERYRVGLGAVIENTIANELAKESAHKAVFGIPSGNIRKEFISDANGLFSGEKLYSFLLDEYERKYRADQMAVLDRRNPVIHDE